MEDIEEVKEFQYLGYIFRKDASCKGQIENIKKKAMRQVWGIGERFFRKSFIKRLWLFKKLVNV